MPEPHRIRIPGQVLDQIRTKDDEGEYGKDARFNRKRKAEKNVPSRKEKRKEERLAKKHKRLKTPMPDKSQPKSFSKKQAFEKPGQRVQNHDSDETDPLAQLKALKAAKAAKAQNVKSEKVPAKQKSDGVRIVKEDDLNDDDISGLEEFGEFSDAEAEELDDFDDSEDMEDDEEDAPSDPLAALKALKAKKNGASANPSDNGLKIVKEDELDDDFSGESDDFDHSDIDEDLQNDAGSDLENDFDDSEDFGEISGEEEEDPMAALRKLKEAKMAKKSELQNSGAIETKEKKSKKPEKVIEATFVDPFENDLEFYAKKLGLKDGKKSKLSKTDDDDVVGGLLDGLDFDYLDESEGDEDLGSEDYDSENSEDFGESKQKENPFVAPTNESDDEVPNSEEESQPSKYIPPALRRKLAMEAEGESEDIIALQRAIKGPLNKLSESNLGSIIGEINGLYLNHPRQAVTENLTKILLDSVTQQGRLLDNFVLLHAALIVAIYRLQGVDSGAYFVQTLIEKFESYRHEPRMSKEALNSASLLSSVFTFQLVSSKLLYDIIRELINDLTESNAEILLKIVRNSGNQMRAEDPAALKEIVLLVTTQNAALAKEKVTPRMQFMVETITSLKNNKLTAANDESIQTIVCLKKFLGTAVASKAVDPLQVSLDDIRSVDTRGKWWLVGSAWKGQGNTEEVLVDTVAVNDILDNAEPNWLELARAQRMNTDIRRAIFISIMSANDYVDAMTKLDKLALKKAQEREIPRILVHCAVVEPAWNPYYGILAAKMCDSHSYRKTFQFLLWDLVKSFDTASGGYDSEDSDGGVDTFAGFDDDGESDDEKLKKIMNLGRLFGHLFAEGSLALHLLRTVNFVATSSDIKLFLEVLLVAFLDQVAKKSQVHSIGVGRGKKGMSEQKFDDRTLIERLLKAKEEPALLKGLSLFMSKRLLKSDFILGKKQRKRVEWGVKSATDIIDEFVKEY